ncbi:hypothetical protein NDU88_001745 [Pleurodeles waltl]|uniref:Uncharacterized protein n=1 Tax=Pleurodeles waltl TaxID=8319 RepID=A0AAV7WNM8_PLEWA|nr:hypothetical protein NDU88_001745 [Pleurodeles waltl]
MGADASTTRAAWLGAQGVTASAQPRLYYITSVPRYVTTATPLHHRYRCSRVAPRASASWDHQQRVLPLSGNTHFLDSPPAAWCNSGSAHRRGSRAGAPLSGLQGLSIFTARRPGRTHEHLTFLERETAATGLNLSTPGEKVGARYSLLPTTKGKWLTGVMGCAALIPHVALCFYFFPSLFHIAAGSCVLAIPLVANVKSRAARMGADASTTRAAWLGSQGVTVSAQPRLYYITSVPRYITTCGTRQNKGEPEWLSTTYSL